MSIIVATFEIRGEKDGRKVDLLMNNPESRNMIPNKGNKKYPPFEMQAACTLYKLENNQLYMPSKAVKKSLIIGTAGLKAKNRKIPDLIKGGIFHIEHECPLLDIDSEKNIPIIAEFLPEDKIDPVILADWKGLPWLIKNDHIDIDIRPVKVRGSMIDRARARIKNYKFNIALEIDTIFSVTQILEWLNMAGKYPGLLDYRPGRGGEFGRFTAILKHIQT